MGTRAMPRGLLLRGMLLIASRANVSAAQQNAVTAFEHVAVIPMDRERVLTDQTVVVRGRRIVALGPAKTVRVPASARRIGARGKFLIPGLGDMHAHLYNAVQLPIYLANGVTTVRDMRTGDSVRAFIRRQAAGKLKGPKVYTVTLNDDCPSSGTLAACVAASKAAGDVMFKIRFTARARFDSIVAIARELHMPVGGHVSPVVGLEKSLQVPYRTIEHLWGYFEAVHGTRSDLLIALNADSGKPIVDTAAWMQPGYVVSPSQLRDVVAATRRAGTWNAPTLTVWEQLICGYMTGPGDDTLEATLAPAPSGVLGRIYEMNFPLVKALHDGGAGLLLSTDVPGDSPGFGGFAVHRELELLVQAGLTPYQALETGTRNVALYLGTQDSTGTIAPGKLADLVLLDDNPLTDIRNASAPAGVMAHGRWLGRAALDAMLDSVGVQMSDSFAARQIDRLRREAAQHTGMFIGRHCRAALPVSRAP